MNYYKIMFSLLIVVLAISCNKFLDKKSDEKLAVPSTIADCQALLDNNTNINTCQNTALGEVSADNYYLTTPIWSALSRQGDREAYIWGPEIFFDNPPGSNEWSNLYSVVNRTNIVLEVMQGITRNTQNATAWDNVMGSALFIRSEAFSVLARNYAKAYDAGGADMGIPLRLGSDFNVPSVRASLQETYNRIIADVTSSIQYLPDAPLHVMRPSKAASYALLARVYLSMRNYDKAALYADSSLRLNNTLIDYNTVTANATIPFSRFNAETIYFAQCAPTMLTYTRAKIDSFLYASYDANDLRKQVFFLANSDGTKAFKGNYTGSTTTLFLGIATDEMYLTKAEAICREGDYSGGLTILNSLLVKRWKQGTYVPYTATSQAAALNIILTERRKELLMRDLRWMDIKRLNKETPAIGIRRYINNQLYELQPNDNRFALPLPADIIRLTGMPQNPR